MSWAVKSSERWLTHDGSGWTADPETTHMLGLDGFNFPLTPTGPGATVVDESTLMAAAMFLIPDGKPSGDAPPYPKLPPVIPGVVY